MRYRHRFNIVVPQWRNDADIQDAETLDEAMRFANYFANDNRERPVLVREEWYVELPFGISVERIVVRATLNPSQEETS